MRTLAFTLWTATAVLHLVCIEAGLIIYNGGSPLYLYGRFVPRDCLTTVPIHTEDIGSWKSPPISDDGLYKPQPVEEDVWSKEPDPATNNQPVAINDADSDGADESNDSKTGASWSTSVEYDNGSYKPQPGEDANWSQQPDSTPNDQPVALNEINGSDLGYDVGDETNNSEKSTTLKTSAADDDAADDDAATKPQLQKENDRPKQPSPVWESDSDTSSVSKGLEEGNAGKADAGNEAGTTTLVDLSSADDNAAVEATDLNNGQAAGVDGISKAEADSADNGGDSGSLSDAANWNPDSQAEINAQKNFIKSIPFEPQYIKLKELKSLTG